MTIQEAIESGKPFRRPGAQTWVRETALGTFVDGEFGWCPDRRVILADDWEIKEEPREFWVYVKQVRTGVSDYEFRLYQTRMVGFKEIKVREVTDS